MYIYIYTQSNIDRDRDKNLQPRCGNVVKIKLKRDKYISLGIYDNNTDASENSDVSSKIEREEGEERQRERGGQEWFNQGFRR